MVSNLRREDSQNWGDNVFGGLSVGPEETGSLVGIFAAHDLGPKHSTSDPQRSAKVRQMVQPCQPGAFRRQASHRQGRDRFQGSSASRTESGRGDRQSLLGHDPPVSRLARREWPLKANSAKSVKELRRQQLAPKGLDRSEVRRLLREVELRQDVRANAIFSLFLYTGCRVSDLVALELHDLMLSDRSGTAVFRFAKGSKQRSVPLPVPARRALQSYFESRPPIGNQPSFRRGTRAVDGSWRPGVVRQILGNHRHRPASASAPTHNGPSILGGYRQRSRRPRPNPGPRKLKHDGPIHEADCGEAGRGGGEIELLSRLLRQFLH